MADLGRVDRLLLLLLNPTASYISVGTYGLIAVAIFALLLFAFWMGSIRRLRVWMLKLLCIAAAAASVVVMLYAGLLLSTMPSVPLWNTPWVPALFVLSALSCGSACLLASSAATGQGLVFGRTLRGVVVCDVVVIVLEVLALAGFALSCAGLLTEPANATELAGAASAERLLLGDLAPLMWAGFAVCGLLAPLVLESAALRRWAASPPLMLVVSALVLVGACIMRYCIVQAGMQPSLL